MRNKNYKGRCEKRTSEKSREICRIYDDIQKTYLSVLEGRGDIAEIRCNVWLEGLEMGDYTSDFVCIKADGDLLVRECVFRKYLTKPKTENRKASGRIQDVLAEAWRTRLGAGD